MKFASVAVLALLATSAALAQQTTTPPPTPGTAPAASARSGQMSYYSHTPGEMRASKLIGINVKNNANETIGEINEIILDKDGKVAAVVVGVGGFLGIGQHEVALDFKSLNVKHDPNALTEAGATTITVDATKESLKGAPAWTWASDTPRGTGTQPRPTTPSGTTR